MLIVLFDGVQSLDVTGPLEVFSRIPGSISGRVVFMLRTAFMKLSRVRFLPAPPAYSRRDARARSTQATRTPPKW